MALNDVLTPKQSEVLHTYLTVPHSMIILNGAVRAGKTRINNFIFLYELKRVAKQAKEGGDRHPIYILAGASSGSIYNNVVAELSRQFGIDLKPDKHNHYHLLASILFRYIQSRLQGWLVPVGSRPTEPTLTKQRWLTKKSLTKSATAARCLAVISLSTLTRMFRPTGSNVSLSTTLIQQRVSSPSISRSMTTLSLIRST